MIIQCPLCSTRWRAQDAPETDNPIFKCGRCHHTFRLFPGAPESDERNGAPRSRPAANAASDNLEFIFPRRHPVPRDVVPPAEPQPVRPATPEPEPAVPADDDLPPWDTMPSRDDPTIDSPPASPSAAEARRDDFGSDDRYVLGTPDGEEDDDQGGPTTHDAPLDAAGAPPPHHDLVAELDESLADDDDDLTMRDEEDFDAGDDDLEIDPEDDHDHDVGSAGAGHVLHIKETMSAATPVPAFAPICRLFVVMVALFGFLAIVIRADPEQAATWLSHVPLIGGRLSNDQVLVHRIALRNIEGGYQRLHNTRKVFVISGEAVNNSTTTLERIDVAGTIYDDKGTAEEKVVSTGNRTTVKLADLSESEISYLQRFASRMTLAPGQSARFSIVFLEPPRAVREFSSTVRSARPTTRAAARPQPDRAPDPASVG
jgi:hypothetical protein